MITGYLHTTLETTSKLAPMHTCTQFRKLNIHNILGWCSF